MLGKDELPELLIVDDFSFYSANSQNKLALQVKLFALVNNTCEFITSVLGKKCLYILGDNLESYSMFYEKWVPMLVSISDYGEKKLCLHVSNLYGTKDSCRTKAVYTLYWDKIELQKFDYALPPKNKMDNKEQITESVQVSEVIEL